MQIFFSDASDKLYFMKSLAMVAKLLLTTAVLSQNFNGGSKLDIFCSLNPSFSLLTLPQLSITYHVSSYVGDMLKFFTECWEVIISANQHQEMREGYDTVHSSTMALSQMTYECFR